jgi:hypothetical protein
MELDQGRGLPIRRHRGYNRGEWPCAPPADHAHGRAGWQPEYSPPVHGSLPHRGRHGQDRVALAERRSVRGRAALTRRQARGGLVPTGAGGPAHGLQVRGGGLCISSVVPLGGLPHGGWALLPGPLYGGAGGEHCGPRAKRYLWLCAHRRVHRRAISDDPGDRGLAPVPWRRRRPRPPDTGSAEHPGPSQGPADVSHPGPDTPRLVYLDRRRLGPLSL